MKKIAIAITIALLLCAAIPYTASADISQYWYLSNTASGDNYVMNKGDSTGLSGSVAVNQGSTVIWVANEAASTSVSFPNGDWDVQLKGWGTGGNGSYYDIDIGKWDGNSFTSYGSSEGETGFPGGLLELSISVSGLTVPQNQWLALSLENTGETAWDFYTDGDSWLKSPSTDPGYPVPELSTIILLGSGLAGLGGYLTLRRRKKSYQKA